MEEKEGNQLKMAQKKILCKADKEDKKKTIEKKVGKSETKKGRMHLGCMNCPTTYGP